MTARRAIVLVAAFFAAFAVMLWAVDRLWWRGVAW